MLSCTDGIYGEQIEAAQGGSSRIEPLPLMADRTEQIPYPVEALGPVLAAAAAATARATFAPLSIAAQSTLAAVSLAVQAHFDVELPTGSARPTTLHLVTVAESGDRKSATDDMVMQPIWRWQEEQEEEYERRALDVQHAQAAWDETRKQTTQTYKSKGRDALEEAYRQLGERPEPPPHPTMVMRSGTTQSILKRFATSRPSMGLMSDEGGSWLGGYGMTEDNRLLTIAILSDFWDGKSVQINTAGEGFTALRGKRLAFHLMIQPVLAGRLLGNAEAQGQGFLSRLLVAQPTSLAGTRIVNPDNRNSPEDQQALEAYRGRLRQIIEARLPLVEDTLILQPRTLTLSPDAVAMWWAFYNSIERRLGPEGDLSQVKGFVGKLPEQAARIAACVHVFHEGVREPVITAQSLARGIALAEFYLSEALRLFGQQAARPELEDAQVLSDWLRDKWGENLISISAISQDGPGRLRRGAEYVRALVDILARHDHLSDRLPNGGMVKGKKSRDAWRVIVGRG